MSEPLERTIVYCMVSPTERLSLRVNCEGVYRIYIADELNGGQDELENTLDRVRADEIYNYYKNLDNR